jgi:hypothetical protein
MPVQKAQQTSFSILQKKGQIIPAFSPQRIGWNLFNDQQKITMVEAKNASMDKHTYGVTAGYEIEFDESSNYFQPFVPYSSTPPAHDKSNEKELRFIEAKYVFAEGHGNNMFTVGGHNHNRAKYLKPVDTITLSLELGNVTTDTKFKLPMFPTYMRTKLLASKTSDDHPDVKPTGVTYIPIVINGANVTFKEQPSTGRNHPYSAFAVSGNRLSNEVNVPEFTNTLRGNAMTSLIDTGDKVCQLELGETSPLVTLNEEGDSTVHPVRQTDFKTLAYEVPGLYDFCNIHIAYDVFVLNYSLDNGSTPYDAITAASSGIYLLIPKDVTVEVWDTGDTQPVEVTPTNTHDSTPYVVGDPINYNTSEFSDTAIDVTSSYWSQLKLGLYAGQNSSNNQTLITPYIKINNNSYYSFNEVGIPFSNDNNPIVSIAIDRVKVLDEREGYCAYLAFYTLVYDNEATETLTLEYVYKNTDEWSGGSYLSAIDNRQRLFTYQVNKARESSDSTIYSQSKELFDKIGSFEEFDLSIAPENFKEVSGNIYAGSGHMLSRLAKSSVNIEMSCSFLANVPDFGFRDKPYYVWEDGREFCIKGFAIPSFFPSLELYNLNAVAYGVCEEATNWGDIVGKEATEQVIGDNSTFARNPLPHSQLFFSTPETVPGNVYGSMPATSKDVLGGDLLRSRELKYQRSIFAGGVAFVQDRNKLYQALDKFSLHPNLGKRMVDETGDFYGCTNLVFASNDTRTNVYRVAVSEQSHDVFLSHAYTIPGRCLDTPIVKGKNIIGCFNVSGRNMIYVVNTEGIYAVTELTNANGDPFNNNIHFARIDNTRDAFIGHTEEEQGTYFYPWSISDKGDVVKHSGQSKLDTFIKGATNVETLIGRELLLLTDDGNYSGFKMTEATTFDIDSSTYSPGKYPDSESVAKWLVVTYDKPASADYVIKINGVSKNYGTFTGTVHRIKLNEQPIKTISYGINNCNGTLLDVKLTVESSSGNIA